MVLITLVTAGCGLADSTTSPDVDATVEARVQSILATERVTPTVNILQTIEAAIAAAAVTTPDIDSTSLLPTSSPPPAQTAIAILPTSASSPVPTATAIPQPTVIPTPVCTPDAPAEVYALTAGRTLGYSGENLTFRVAGHITEQTANWEMGSSTVLNLTASSEDGVVSSRSSPTIRNWIPHLFTGTVIIDCQSAPIGTEVTAWIGGTQVGIATVGKVVPTNFTDAVPTDVAALVYFLDSLGTNLKVVWHYNAFQTWEYYFTDAKFKDLNTLKPDGAGGFWVSVNETQDFAHDSGKVLVSTDWNLIRLKTPPQVNPD